MKMSMMYGKAYGDGVWKGQYSKALTRGKSAAWSRVERNGRDVCFCGGSFFWGFGGLQRAKHSLAPRLRSTKWWLAFV